MLRAASIVAIVAAVLSSPRPAGADTLTAICDEPHGFIVGSANGKDVAEPDKVTGGGVTVTWQDDVDTASIVSAGPAGPISERGALVLASPEQLSFLVVYRKPAGSAVWLYTLFPRAKRLVTTQHVAWGAGNPVLGKAFASKCTVSYR